MRQRLARLVGVDNRSDAREKASQCGTAKNGSRAWFRRAGGRVRLVPDRSTKTARRERLGKVAVSAYNRKKRGENHQDWEGREKKKGQFRQCQPPSLSGMRSEGGGGCKEVCEWRRFAGSQGVLPL